MYVYYAIGIVLWNGSGVNWVWKVAAEGRYEVGEEACDDSPMYSQGSSCQDCPD